jgi:hypothetical protein
LGFHNQKALGFQLNAIAGKPDRAIQFMTAVPMYDVIETTLSSLKKYHVDRVVLSPERWADFASPVTLSWSAVKFDRTQRGLVPNSSGGVYTFVVKPGIANHSDCAYLLYVGKAEDQDLRTRFLQYFSEKDSRKGRPKVQKMLRLWENHLWFCYATIGDTGQIDTVEQNLISAYLPPMNDQFPAEVRGAMKAW